MALRRPSGGRRALCGRKNNERCEGSPRLDSIEVDVQARVGRLAMTLGQVRLLGAGQVLEFSTPVESPVTLLANGRPVATGELVDVGGRVGVRIVAMAEE